MEANRGPMPGWIEGEASPIETRMHDKPRGPRHASHVADRSGRSRAPAASVVEGPWRSSCAPELRVSAPRASFVSSVERPHLDRAAVDDPDHDSGR